MGRPPKPAKVLELNGSASHDKKRYASRVAAVAGGEPLGDPPAHWQKASSYPKGALAAIWDERKADCPAGLLTTEHAALFEGLCVATYESRRPGKQQLRWISEVTKMLRLLGLTPVDRAKIDLQAGAGARKPEGKLAAFVKRKA